MSTGKQIIEKDLKLLESCIVKNMNNFRTVVNQNVGASLRRRIFNTGIATDGSLIGKYAELTKKIRKAKGRQTARVDLEDTGTLRRAVISGNSKNIVVLGIADQLEPSSKNLSTADNASEQEDHFGKDIFAPSEAEVKEGDKVFAFEVNKTVAKCYATKNKVTKVKK